MSESRPRARVGVHETRDGPQPKAIDHDRRVLVDACDCALRRGSIENTNSGVPEETPVSGGSVNKRAILYAARS